MTLPLVWTHSRLRCRGGAAAVARALHSALAEAGAGAGFGFELADADCPALPGETACAPGQAGVLARADLVHVHGSGSWAGCLDSLAPGRVLVTLHDCRLLTGGCPYPLDCQAWLEGCPADCPRQFPAADQVWLEQRRAVGRCAPVLAAPSGWMARLARQAFADLSVRVVPNGVDRPQDLPGRAEAKARCGLGPETPLALFAAHGGEAAAYKAGDRWQELWRSMADQVPGAACFMVGGQGASREGGLVRWPYLDKETLRLFMRAADVFVYPSLADNHPLLVLEAMSAGAAVVAFAVGGIPEQIAPGRTGLLVPAGDWDGLAREAAALLRRPGLARRLGKAAQDQGRERFGLGRMVADHLALYADLAG